MSAPNKKMEKNLFIGNLPYSVTDDQLKDIFSKAGSVVSARVITDKFSGRSKGFGFVEMETEEEAQKAISSLDGFSVDGRNIRVSEAKPKEERAPRN